MMPRAVDPSNVRGGGDDDHPFSVTVVRGCRAAVAAVTYRPVIALRCAVPVARLPPAGLVTTTVMHDEDDAESMA